MKLLSEPRVNRTLSGCAAGDLEAPMKPPPPAPPPGVGGILLAQRSAAEEAGGEMNLFRRYCLVNDSLGEAMQDESPHSMGALLAWLRLSSSRQLDWYVLLFLFLSVGPFLILLLF